MWLGSDFCARHILRHLHQPAQTPFFWTREQRGEEASTWLLFRHKYAYLRETSRRFGGREDPLVRAFCLPEGTAQETPRWERLLLFLAIALMESLGIKVLVSAEPQHAGLQGFVRSARHRVIIANWVRSDGIWFVDATERRGVVREFADAAAHLNTYSAIDGPGAQERLRSLASYLTLDWDWLRQRCQDLAAAGWAGFTKPRSRLLSVDALDAACGYVGGLR